MWKHKKNGTLRFEVCLERKIFWGKEMDPKKEKKDYCIMHKEREGRD